MAKYTSVESAVAALSAALTRSVEQTVRAAVSAEITSRKLAAPAGTKSAARAKVWGDRATEAEVVRFLGKNPGSRTEAVSKGLGKDAKFALHKLRDAGMVKVKGQRRAATYSLTAKAANGLAKGSKETSKAKAKPTKKVKVEAKLAKKVKPANKSDKKPSKVEADKSVVFNTLFDPAATEKTATATVTA